MTESRKTGRDARILIIDNDPRTLSATSRLLAEAGYQTFEAATGREGLRLARRIKPDLVLLDIMLPDMSGSQVYRRIKTDPALAGTHVTLFSGLDVDSNIEAEALVEDVWDVILRPISDRDLLTHVEAKLPPRRATVRALREQIKELDCLYSISKLAQDTDLSLREVLQGTVERIPPGWQYPEIARARIILDGQAFETPGFRETIWKQRCDIRVYTRTAGCLEVHYLEERPTEDEGPFLEDERSLLNAIAEQLGRIVERHQAEEALQRERDLVARIMDTSPVGVLMFDQDGRITFANARTQEMAGLLGIADLVGSAYNDPAWRLIDEHGDPLPDDSLPFARVLSSRQPVSEVLYATDLPGGQRVYLSSSAAPLLDRSGAFDGVIVTTQDVTDRVQAEARLQESENLHRRLLETLQEGIWMIDQDACTVFANPRMAEMLGYTVKEMMGRHLFSFMDEQGITLCQDNLERRQHGIREQHDFEFLRKDGSRLYASLEASPIFDEEGNYEGSLAGVQDISDRVKTTERLRESEERYRDLVEKVNDVIYALDRDGAIAYVSPAIERVLGYTSEQVIGRPFSHFIVPEDQDQASANFQRLVSGSGGGPNEYRVIAASGEARWIRLSSQPSFDGDQITGIRGVLTDISESVWAQEQREAAAAAAERQRLARDLHDAVTQSLFSVSAIAEALPTVWEHDQAEARRGLEELRRLTQGALAEMRTLLLELRPSALLEQELDVLVHQLAEALAARTQMPITTEVVGDCTLPTEARIALYRVAQEALNNIVKHARASRATIDLHCQPGYARLKISDDGRGFDPQTVQSGKLGLEIMQERAQSIGASLEIESQPGQGTRVLVEWPGNQEGQEDG